MSFYLRRYIGLLALSLLLTVPNKAHGIPESHIREVLLAADLRQTKVAVLAVDLDTQEVLASINADEPMIPASNMKLVTTAAALHVLGPDYVFQTKLRLIRPEEWGQNPDSSSPPIPTQEGGDNPGTVLIVQGDGDPGFCDPDLLREHQWDVDRLLEVWTQAVRNQGVKKIQTLIIDDRVFDYQMVHPDWPQKQLEKWYCAQVAGLNFYGNCLDIYPIPTQPGQSPKITIFPSSAPVRITNKVVTGKSDTIWVTREPLTNKITVGGTVKHRRTTPIVVTLHDPPMVFAQLFAEHLHREGITVHKIDRPGRDARLPDGQTLHVVQTTLPAVLQRCNKDSQNLFAEALLKRMGRKFTGTAGSWDNAAAAGRYFLQDQVGPIGAAVTISDGSGLSNENRVTPRVLVEILRQMHENPQLGDIFRESLAIGGEDGTLRNRFKQGLTARVYAKSGYIKEVSCLSGYLVFPGNRNDDTARPRTVAFSLMFNDFQPPVHVYKIKKAQEAVVKVLDQYLSEERRPRRAVVESR